MHAPFVRLFKYIKYFITSSNRKGHGIHSPFVYDFVRNVLNDKRKFYSFEKIETLRKKLLTHHQSITIEDLGAGSSSLKSKTKKISQIATYSLTTKKNAQLLFKIINYYSPQTILELGTSFGITTSYLASANIQGSVITLEGDTQIAAIAKNNFEELKLNNIQLIEGNFDVTLHEALGKFPKLDFAFIDGNHRKETTIRYFETILKYSHTHSILVFDDIHWSPEMEEAWSSIKNHPQVKCTIDLFYYGIVFFNPSFLEKQHFTIFF